MLEFEYDKIWSELKAQLRKSFGEDVLKYDSQRKRGVVTEGNQLLAIITKDTNKDGLDELNLFLRASIFPNTSALLAATCSLICKTYIDENFEISDTGNWLQGKEALLYFAKNADKFWKEEGRPKETSNLDSMPEPLSKTLH